MKTNLKDNIYIEGFDSLESGYIIQDIIAKKCEEFIYAGKTSEIPEELAEEYVVYDDYSDEYAYKGCFRNYKNFNSDGDIINYEVQVGFETAKESIQSACDKEYCIIYKI